MNKSVNKKKAKKTLSNKVSKNKEIPEILDNTVEEISKYSPEKGEKVIYNPYERFTGPDDRLCKIIEKKSVKDINYYKLELIDLKRTRSKGVSRIEWDSGIFYEDIPEKNILILLELFTY